MNDLSSQDFQKAVDYTALEAISGSLLNQGFDGIQPNPKALDETQGIGMVICTNDSALDTPVVPDPTESADYTKWKRYLWVRKPHASADPTVTPIVYAWNDNLLSHPIKLKWADTRENIKSLETQVTTNTNNITTVTTLVNAANTNASAALTAATNASTNATAAANNAATALNAANIANTAATNALNTANTANTNATAAQAAAATAINAANGNKTVTQITPGAAGQRIRVKNGAIVENEYYSVVNTIAILTEQVANTGNFVTSSSAAFAGGAWSTRVLNTEVRDSGDLVAVNANKFQPAKGTYRITARVPFANTDIDALVGSVSRLYNVTDGTPELIGTYNTVCNIDNAATAMGNVGVNYITGTFSTDGSKEYRIETYADGGVGTYHGGRGFSGGGAQPSPNRYTIVELELIG